MYVDTSLSKGDKKKKILEDIFIGLMDLPGDQSDPATSSTLRNLVSILHISLMHYIFTFRTSAALFFLSTSLLYLASVTQEPAAVKSKLIKLRTQVVLFLCMYDRCRYGHMVTEQTSLQLRITSSIVFPSSPAWGIHVPTQPVNRMPLKHLPISSDCSLFSFPRVPFTSCLPAKPSSFCPSLFRTWECGVSLSAPRIAGRGDREDEERVSLGRDLIEAVGRLSNYRTDRRLGALKSSISLKVKLLRNNFQYTKIREGHQNQSLMPRTHKCTH